MNVQEALIAIDELLPNEAAWTKGHYALNALGETCLPKEARQLCIVAAFHLVLQRNTRINILKVFERLQSAGGYTGFVASYEDSHSFIEIKRTLKKAIEGSKGLL